MLSSSLTAVPLTPVLRTGDVNVLLVNVCEPVSVVTVESMANVRSNGSASEPVDVSVQLISIPPPSTNLTSLSFTICTSVPSPSSSTNCMSAFLEST